MTVRYRPVTFLWHRKPMTLVLIFFFFNKMKHNILVPRAAIILPSATDQVLRLVPKQEVTNRGFPAFCAASGIWKNIPYQRLQTWHSCLSAGLSTNGKPKLSIYGADFKLRSSKNKNGNLMGINGVLLLNPGAININPVLIFWPTL